MAVWPFGKKSKSAAAAASSTRDISVATEKSPLAARKAAAVVPTADSTAKPAAVANNDAQPRTPRKLSRSESNRRRRASTRSSKGGKQPPLEAHDPMPPNAKSTADRVKADTKDSAGEQQSHYYRHAISKTSIVSEQQGALQRPPTLRAKRSAHNDPGLLRRKSSKKRKSDHVREEQIKSMSSPVPIPKRPATHGGGDLLRRDSRKMHGGLNKHLERPTSEISLPIPESLHSSFSSTSDRRGFKVRSLDVFSPRPTIRYSQQGRELAPPQIPWSTPSRSNSKRDREVRTTIPEETLKEKKTIDDLADDLDAGALRELMDRDERRREKKRMSDTDTAKRRLQRKADHQSEQEQLRDGRELPPDLDRGFLGREAMSPRQAESSTATVRDEGPPGHPAFANDRNTSPVSWLHDPSREYLSREYISKDPFADGGPADSRPHTEQPTPADEKEEPGLGTARAVRVSQGSMSPPGSPKYNIFAPPNAPPPTDLNRQSTTSETIDPRASGASVGASDQQPYGSSWTSFFRRSIQRPKRLSADQGRQTPSEFSNTSRDSLQQQQQQRQSRSLAYQSSVRRKSGTPVRTQSKFKEDLPDLPISPPDSRMQSPEAALVESAHENVIPERAESSLAEKISMAASSVDPPDPFADPASGSRAKGDRSARESRSMDVPSPEGGAPTVSQSLASIDSEGSWLSGRPAKRNSQPLSPPLRESVSSLQRRGETDFSDSAEELGVAEDEYFSRLTPGPETTFRLGGGEPSGSTRKPSSTAMASESLGDDDANERQTLHHGTVARQPTIVHHNTRAHSSEGLLNQFRADSPETGTLPDDAEGHSLSGAIVDPDSPRTAKSSSEHDTDAPLSFLDMPEDEEMAASKPQRATSVDLNKRHVRHISAGSAKLLDIPSHGSGVSSGERDGKRLSAGSARSGSEGGQ